MPQENKILTSITPKREVIFEKISPKIRVRAAFIELFINSEVWSVDPNHTLATTFYLVKNEKVLMEINRVSKRVFIADSVLDKIVQDIFFKMDKIVQDIFFKMSFNFEDINEAIANCIKKDIKLDLNDVYTVSDLGGDLDVSYVKDHAKPVDAEKLYGDTISLDEAVDNIMTIFK